jgi:hypothetical protein
MRMVLGVLSLLFVVAIVGFLVKKQTSPAAAPAAQAVPGVVAPSGTPQQQVQQVQKAVEGAVQQARPMPEEK